MSKVMNVRAVLVERNGLDELTRTPGAFRYVRNANNVEVGIVHSCPCGCGHLSGVYFAPSVNKVLWERSGTREAPTFKPSIGVHAAMSTHDKEADGYHWHGYLTDGVWRSV